MGEVVAVIPARGGSKGVPGKNLREVCGKPLLAWSILQAKAAELISSVWVSSDSTEILGVAEEYGAHGIERPSELAGDEASSESAWLHSLDHLTLHKIEADLIVGMQAMSPIREPTDLDLGIAKVREEGLDSLLSVVQVQDHFVWRIGANGPESVNYDFQSRKRRQLIEPRYLENGSFYVFTPEILRKFENRIGGRIGIHVMERHKMFQIDSVEEAELVEKIMYGFHMDKS